MKNNNAYAPYVFVLLVAVLAASPLLAQIPGLPRVSQKASVTQAIGITEVTVEYHRPFVRGREIYGGQVPYGQVWRAGANDNTTITFSDPVKVEGQDLAAGTYGLHMLPTEEGWTVIFSENSTSWGSFSYDEAEDALRVEVKARKAPFQEILEYRFDDLSNEGGTVAVRWEELEVPFRVDVDTHALVFAKIRRDLRSTAGFNWMGANGAAAYALQADTNYEEALGWTDQSIQANENATNLRTKALLLDQMGKSEEAGQIMARVLEIGNEAEINQLGYFYLMQRQDHEKAIAVFEKNVKDHPESWNCYDSLGESQAAAGMTQKAVANYSKALEMAPEAQHARIQGTLENLKSEG